MATSREPSAADNNLSSLYVDEDIQTVVNACLNDLGRPPPPVSFFRQLAKEPPIPPTKEIVQARMDQQRTRHKEELEIMYDVQAKARKELLLQYRIAMDHGDYYPDPNIGERSRQRPAKLPPEMSYASALLSILLITDNRTACLHDTAASQLPLVTMLNELEERRNIVLPKSLAEFNLIKAPTHQVRVARFFEGKTGPWAGIAQNSAEIEAALLAYKTDPEFQRVVIAFLNSKQSVDPRKRASIP
ncbi:hypothetical protein PIIN_02400 [Serendipita indica DSM 11827]|uniref:Uncharacterized protein n=1 Tax=Serendipita indica (strain DSM 11827) TaxID=1109443 RepID=G4TB62_SERID|nr:hypothetical protein PIIN_02400 [Serendipita indica DSM 11827]